MCRWRSSRRPCQDEGARQLTGQGRTQVTAGCVGGRGSSGRLARLGRMSAQRCTPQPARVTRLSHEYARHGPGEFLQTDRQVVVVVRSMPIAACWSTEAPTSTPRGVGVSTRHSERGPARADGAVPLPDMSRGCRLVHSDSPAFARLLQDVCPTALELASVAVDQVRRHRVRREARSPSHVDWPPGGCCLEGRPRPRLMAQRAASRPFCVLESAATSCSAPGP